MTTVGKVHSQYGVTRLEQRKIGGHVGLGAGVWLYIDILGPKQGLGTIDGQLFSDIDKLAAAVISFSRISFGILIG